LKTIVEDSSQNPFVGFDEKYPAWLVFAKIKSDNQKIGNRYFWANPTTP
jgi:hypothetical protein